MPLVAKDRQDFYKARIRALLSVDHQATPALSAWKLRHQHPTPEYPESVQNRSLVVKSSHPKYFIFNHLQADCTILIAFSVCAS